jgi:hypothetical protein
MTNVLNSSKRVLTIRLRPRIAESLQEMYELHQPCQTKLSLEQFVMMIVESSVADFRCKKYTPRVKPFAPRAHYDSTGEGSFNLVGLCDSI